VKAESSGEDPRTTGGLVSNLPHPRVNKTKKHATSLRPKKEDSSRWVSTLVPPTLLPVDSNHAAKLNKNRMLYNVSDATKVQIMGYYLTQIKGQSLDILWVFSSVEIFYHRNFLDTVHGRKSSHLMASSHSGFSLFDHYNLQGSCLRTVIQPLAETTGLLISWVFSFLPRPYQPQRINKVGVSC